VLGLVCFRQTSTRIVPLLPYFSFNSASVAFGLTSAAACQRVSTFLRSQILPTSRKLCPAKAVQLHLGATPTQITLLSP
jgi:hypothetical protein